MNTPSLLLDLDIMAANIARLDRHLEGSGVVLRPHVKTCKSAPVVARMLGTHLEQRITVSTLEEARQLHAFGYTDVLYAVGLAPQKIAAVAQLLAAGMRLAVIVDNAVAAAAVVAAAPTLTRPLGVFIELDVDGERAGVDPAGPELLTLAQQLSQVPGVELRGVMTHAGGVYHCTDRMALTAMARHERVTAVAAASRLRAAGIACPEVSVGSTPTAFGASDFTGITELRAGVYVFNDLTMVGLGVCALEDIALSVLTTVIGHQPKRDTLLVDAGWMALSNDRSTTGYAIDQGLGLVAEDRNLIVSGANQEHGLIRRRDGGPLDCTRYPIGTQLRVLPVHACATAAQFSCYQLRSNSATGGTAEETWPRFGGWGL